MTFALRLLHRTLAHVTNFLLLLLLFWFLLALWGRYSKYQACVGLPNGSIIGREAILDPRTLFNPYRWSPDSRVILKLPNGSPLITDEVFPIYITETTVYGRGEPRDRSKASYAFAYRPDVGLVYEHTDPDTYAKLEGEAGELLDLLFDKYERFVFSEGSGFSYSEDGKFLITKDGRFPINETEKVFVHMDLTVAYQRLRKDPAYRRKNCHVSFFPQ